MAAVASFCKHCGDHPNKLLGCSACHEVRYCNVDHQKADWPKHKKRCKYVRTKPTTVLIEIPPNQGNGLGARMKSHIFTNRSDGLEFLADRCNNCSPALRSLFAELIGWDIEMFCSKNSNTIQQGGDGAFGGGMRGINGAGVYLGCSLKTGLSQYTNLDGTIYVTGRNQRGQTLTTNALWGILNLIYDAMDYYNGTIDTNPVEALERWKTKYKNGSWVPAGGNGGIHVYNVDPMTSFQSKQDHRSEKVEDAANDDELVTDPLILQEMYHKMHIINTQKLLEALDADMFPMKEVGEVVGIEIDTPHGKLIYNVYSEIYKHHLTKGKNLRDELIRALSTAALPGSFQRWTRNVVEDDTFLLDTYSRTLVQKGFDDEYINPENEIHCDWMNKLRKWHK